MNVAMDIFLLDSNTLIEPSKKFYSFRIAPGFWTFLQNEIFDGNILVIDVVAKEISKGRDTLADWLDETNVVPLDRRSPDILTGYTKVLNYVHQNSAYSDRALALWSDSSHADPWIVAFAIARGCTVITFEQPNTSLGTSQTSKPKIPDVCSAFGVNCINLFQFLDIRNFSFPTHTDSFHDL